MRINLSHGKVVVNTGNHPPEILIYQFHLSGIIKTNDFRGPNQHVPVSKEVESRSDHLVIELAGVIAACRMARSGEPAARELLTIN